MASLKNIKIKIGSVHKTRKVTRAMEAVSAVKMRKSQDRALLARPYARAALRILVGLSETVDLLHHPLTTESDVGKVAVVIITSDKGLAGNLNSAVLRKVEMFMKEHSLTKKNTVFLCLGRRGYEFAATRGYEIVHFEINLSDDVSEMELRVLSDTLVGMKTKGEIREVRVAYTNFKSTFEQEAVMHRILPLSQNVLDHIIRGILPQKGMHSELREQEGIKVSAYTMEPDREEVLNALLPRLVNIAVFHKLLESKASEHSARMVAMKSATDKAAEVARDLTLVFNKARQAAITQEVSEITSGIEAMK
ncbi:MAG: ATP synthase F1 subunit gamma [Candidatus Harrisonbacteria bacterium CG10_big_fil_rev_8_21_14_0_10_42_17]|uniref:ATP synthase gamma chain n=1 Tax=Candidatus Harrisonbacteria bacterium CG10_big_fil_rev_8_21_14_0_10_42_17 TaxID=1974584 RepID=A0A2M6WIA5_9BACT|nr:MAG: ATP synthase F1 subunit gamma [Candidatus Harrisonbacteria bacterium CG10_big_fil_rev_8_21_14_0_10_42_17]